MSGNIQQILRALAPRPRKLYVTGKVALVTGAADGIGFETARLLREKGALVAIVDRDEAAAQRAAKLLGETHAIAIAADVTDRQAMKAAVDSTIAKFGRLDVIVANAGITPAPAPVRTIDLENFDRVIAVNLTGVLNTIHPAIEELIRQKGHIVLVASVAAFCPSMCGAAYGASKAGVEQLGRALKIELAQHGVSVTISYFGTVDTALTRNALDHDPEGARVNQLMPSFVRRRISGRQAADVIVESVTSRAEHSMAPMTWEMYSVLRGMVNPVLDRVLAGNPEMLSIISTLENRQRIKR